MAYFATVNGDGDVVRVEVGVHLPAAPPGHQVVELSSWGGWPPNRPHAGAKLRVVNGEAAWVDLRPIVELRAAKWAQIKAERARRIALPKPTPIGNLDSGPAGIGNVNSVVLLLRTIVARGGPNTTRFTLADNTRVTITLAQLEQAAIDMGVAIQGIYDTADTLRQAIAAAQSAQDLQAISWPT